MGNERHGAPRAMGTEDPQGIWDVLGRYRALGAGIVQAVQGGQWEAAWELTQQRGDLCRTAQRRLGHWDGQGSPGPGAALDPGVRALLQDALHGDRLAEAGLREAMELVARELGAIGRAASAAGLLQGPPPRARFLDTAG
jgi:hypothetical protein